MRSNASDLYDVKICASIVYLYQKHERLRRVPVHFSRIHNTFRLFYEDKYKAHDIDETFCMSFSQSEASIGRRPTD